jgi:hypothetical protein
MPIGEAWRRTVCLQLRCDSISDTGGTSHVVAAEAGIEIVPAEAIVMRCCLRRNALQWSEQHFLVAGTVETPTTMTLNWCGRACVH